MPLDQTMNQSVEFLSDGIRYYQFHGYLNNLKYYYGVLFNKAENICNLISMKIFKVLN